jgi:hypothetical protein
MDGVNKEVGSEMVDNEPELVEHRPSDLGGV